MFSENLRTNFPLGVSVLGGGESHSPACSEQLQLNECNEGAMCAKYVDLRISCNDFLWWDFHLYKTVDTVRQENISLPCDLFEKTTSHLLGFVFKLYSISKEILMNINYKLKVCYFG